MKKAFKNFNTFMAVVACSAFGMILTSCAKESFDVKSQTSGSTSSTTQEIVIPQNDAKIIVSVSARDGYTFKDLNATIRMNGEVFSGSKTWTAPSIQQMELYFTAEASGYYTAEKKVVTPTVNKGEFIYLPIVIDMRAQESTDPYIEPAEEPKESVAALPYTEQPNELDAILALAAATTEPTLTVSMTAPAPKGTKLSNKSNFNTCVELISWDDPIIDYTKWFNPEIDSKGITEKTTIKNVQDKLYAWSESHSGEWQQEDVVFTDVTIPSKVIGIEVLVKTHFVNYLSDVYIDIDVDGETKEFGIKNAPFSEVTSNELVITVKKEEGGTVKTDTIPSSYHHGGGGGDE